MNLKNYTSGVPAATTISYIEAYLASSGVEGIHKEYKDGQCRALFFTTTEKGKLFTIRLPAQVEDVQKFLFTEYCKSVRTPRKTIEDFLDQAGRTAWKIQQDWVQVQMSLVQLKQATVLQVFLAFAWDGEQTFFQRLEDRGFKQLAEKAST